MNGMEFDFSVGFDKKIEDISRYDENIPHEVYDEFLQKIIDKKKIIIGERSEGYIKVKNDIVKIDYRWCSNIGEDWNSDVWKDEVVEFPLTEIQ
jgi:hypothetical protein